MMTRGLGDDRVLNPGMNEAIPENVYETDKFGVVSRHYPAEAVLMNQFVAVPLSLVVDTGLESFGVKLVQLTVIELAAPRVGDRHVVTLKGP
jgi:hypothetical protein